MLAVAGAVILLAVGYATGHNGQSGLQQNLSQARASLSAAQSGLSAARQQLTTAQGKLTTTQGKLAAAQAQAAQEKTAAQQATSAADAAAKAKYASAMATITQQEKTLASEQKTVAAQEGSIQASAISASGVYVVGQDIKSGTWHTSGDGGQTDNACYFATLNSDNTSDIADNNNFDGAETVSVVGVYALEIDGPCTWYLEP